MDDQFAELGRFIADLESFNDALTAAVRELDRQHEEASILWRDSNRQEFDRRWDDVRSPVDRYLTRDAERYLEFLRTRRQALGRYLHGR